METFSFEKALGTTLQPARERLLLNFPVPDPQTLFSGPGGESPELGYAILGSFGSIRIDLDQVADHAIDSGPELWNFC